MRPRAIARVDPPEAGERAYVADVCGLVGFGVRDEAGVSTVIPLLASSRASRTIRGSSMPATCRPGMSSTV